MSHRVSHRLVSLSLAGLLTAGALAGCGSSSSSGASRPARTFGSGGPGLAGDPAQLAKIRRCLKAAGLSSSLPTARPSGSPSGEPTGAPSGPGGAFADPQVQAALKACGITFRARYSSSGAPTGTPTP
jgi:hypothetical protein